MKNKLQQYFPMIRTKEALLKEIMEKESTRQIFVRWNEVQKKEFLDICTGVKGIKFLYDSFFKEVMNPESTPERLEEFLGLLLNCKIKIIQILPVESRLAEEHSLLTMDIIVELDDGTICNIEVQKIGYTFPGQRSACYSADLLLRQYKRIRSESRKKHVYDMVKTVYTIVLFENSPREFKKFPDTYCHYFEQLSNTGLKMELLQKYIFLPLDVFKNSIYTKGIKNKLDSWLAFLSIDDPDIIQELICQYPEFKPMYEQMYQFCQNVEGIMERFSEELRILDQNTVRYMMDEMQEEINQQKQELQKKTELLARQERLYEAALIRIQELENGAAEVPEALE